MVAICAKTEAELVEMDDEDARMFLAEMGQDEPGLNRLIRAAFKLLGLQTYFTAGVKEVRAWTIPSATPRPQAAGGSTPTSSAASSAPRPSPSTTSSSSRANKAPRTPARCAPRWAPCIWLGAMGINFAAQWQLSGTAPVLNAALVSLGATAQAALGAWLIRRRDTQLTLTNHSDIGRFFMVSASA